MKKILFLLLFCPLIGSSQEDQGNQRFVHAGLLCGDISLAPGMLVQQNISTISVPGTLEFYLDDHVSFKADVYYHITSGLTTDSMRLVANHQLFVGMSYHFTTRGNFDPYFGFQPGVSYAQLSRESKLPSTDQTPYGNVEFTPNLVPVLGLSAGFNMYFSRYFHLFVEARYVHGTLLFNAPFSFPLDEFKLQFGLGWNLNVIRKKKS